MKLISVEINSETSVKHLLSTILLIFTKDLHLVSTFLDNLSLKLCQNIENNWKEIKITCMRMLFDFSDILRPEGFFSERFS